ncbi:MAG: isopentenyl-diphosphate Delta-isomerase [Sphingomonadaceae bacterium]
MIDEAERVVLVDEEDRERGAHSKLSAHREALRHRAFSVFIFDSQGRALLQSRSLAKYHSGGLWSNACCGHPRPGESSEAAAGRRLAEEMGIEVRLRPVGQLSYFAELAGGWFENEIVHLFTGFSDEAPRPDPGEVRGWRRVEPDDLLAEVARAPENFTTWFGIYLSRVPEIALGRA